ncbi:Sodium/potassium/calcium exchanger 3 [Thelohanellus kitauei]|uniref:Sodium/potassium/calcium exchanger 3 n=1 Tax=Thelohanellus kitauei TaxID=669202 RepID=A0A0C2JGR4_THEKT|nr:Sodium/potassium/calcium exchanger 3 [Thelohanellus kitauei]
MVINPRSILVFIFCRLIKTHTTEDPGNGVSNQTLHNSIAEFPKDIFSDSQYPRLISIIHFVVSIYIFTAIAILCENYFVPSLEYLSIKLNMRSDVAGATLMAIGGSMPELWVALVGN